MNTRERFENVVTWLLANKILWIELNYRNHFSAAGLELAVKMRAAGLFSKKTYIKDIRWERYVEAARRRL